jgi:hypothetical protein
MKSSKTIILDILFFGAIWGILEATVGYVLHFVPTFLAGSIMFPIASVLLLRAYNKTGSKASLLWIGVVAASIKSVNLLMPAMSIWKTINPMISIVFEALMVFAVVKLLSGKQVASKLIALPIASISWRILFIGNMGIQFLITGFLSNHLKDFGIAFEFVVISGLISGAFATLLYLGSLAFDKKVVSRYQVRPALAGVLLVLAVALTVVL